LAISYERDGDIDSKDELLRRALVIAIAPGREADHQLRSSGLRGVR
jgi:hypothetical protein